MKYFSKTSPENIQTVFNTINTLYWRTKRPIARLTLNNFLRNKLKSSHISFALRHLHKEGKIEMINFCIKPVVLGNVRLTPAFVEIIAEDFKRVHGHYCGSSKELANFIENNYGIPEEKDPERKIRKYAQDKLIGRYEGKYMPRSEMQKRNGSSTSMIFTNRGLGEFVGVKHG